MVSDLFGTILQELGRRLRLSLRPDAHNSCLIRLKDTRVQLEIDEDSQALIIGTVIGTVPPGRYRENFFTEALKANGLPQPRHGIFAYSQKTDQLILFEKMPLKDLTGDKVADFLPLFLEKAKLWKDSLAKNEVPVIAKTFTSRAPTGMFGLR